MSNYLNNTTNAKFIPTIIANKALGAFAGYMNLAKTVARDFDYTPAKEGQVIRVAKRGTLTANAKAAGSDVTLQNPTATDVAVTLDNHYEVTIGIEDVTSVLQNQDTLNGYAEDAAIALAEKIESTILALHPSITNTITGGATVSEANILALRKRFAENKVPFSERKYLYVYPSVVNDLLALDRFTRADAYGKTGVIAEGALGRIHGFDVFESQLVPATGSPVAYHNLAYTRNGIILAVRTLPVMTGFGVQQSVVMDENTNVGLRVTASYDPKGLAMSITLDCLWGTALLDTRCVAELESF